MSRKLIDRDALIASIPKTNVDIFENCRNCSTLCDWQVRELIEQAELVDAVEVVHGEWIRGREIGKEWNCGYWNTYYEDWHCSNCGVVFEQESKPKYHFCPNCGAKMDGERKDPCSSQAS